MKREIKNNGEYVEIEADNIFENLEAIDTAQVIVITKPRIEFAGKEKHDFVGKLIRMKEKYSAEIEGLSEEQKSDFVLRKSLVE